MRLKIFIYISITCAACGLTKSTYPAKGMKPIENQELNYINKYVIEHTILSPDDWDVNPVLPLNDPSQVDIVIIQLHDDNRSAFENFPYFGEETIDSVIENVNSHKLPFLFANRKHKVLEVFGNFPDKDYNKLLPRELPPNSIVFALGHVYQIDSFNYIPIVYLRKDVNVSYWHFMSRVYKFEICPYGIINFISYYHPDANFNSKENIINSTSCK